MRALRALVIANARGFVRDRAAIFWTFAFPILFVVLFGSIFSSSGPSSFKVGWVDLDGSPTVARMHDGFASVGLLKLTDGTQDASLEQMRKVRAACHGVHCCAPLSALAGSSWAAPSDQTIDVARVGEHAATWEQVVRSHPKSEAATQARALLASLGAPGRTPR